MRSQKLKPLSPCSKNNFFCILILIAIPICMLLSCKKEISCEICGDSNQLPTANAGADQITTLPKDSVALDGSASSDPDGNIIAYNWRKVSGPSSFLIASSASAKTSVRSLVQGVYQFELTVTDDKRASAKDTIQITATGAGVNQAPVANAGPDQMITLPANSVTLNGGSSYDADGTITLYQWTVITGPSTPNLATPTAVQTQVNNLVQGVYQFELTVKDDKGASAKDTVQTMVENQSGGSIVDIYVSGEENGKACYWKNGQKHILSALSQAYNITTSIAVSGNDVYVAGGEVPNIYSVFPNEPTTAKYWKNGSEVILGKELYSYANAIAVVNNDVYVAGSESKFSDSGVVAKYWKNGQAVSLTNGLSNASANSIVVVGGDVYVAGKEGKVAKYWKNGQAVALTNGATDASASSIVVVGLDVYVAGYEGKVAKYWKNGQAVSLTNGLHQGYASSIAVVGNDVYVAGSDNPDEAKYWKNGQPVSLNPDYGAASSICVKNNDVYVAGTGFIIVGGSYPLCWKNGQMLTLTFNGWGSTSGIVVVQH